MGFREAFETEVAVAARLARSAGLLILAEREGGDLEVGTKARGEVVTSADRAANQIILGGLAAEFPDDAVYSEETPDSDARLAHQRVWIVDPLDGTSTYVAGGDEFCVSIGLAVDGRPTVGAVFNPCRDELVAGAIDQGVTLNGAPTGVSDVEHLPRARLSTSRRDMDRGLLPELGAASVTVVASMAYKLARVAAGLHDATLSLVPRKEWGTCAGVALVLAGAGWPPSRLPAKASNAAPADRPAQTPGRCLSSPGRGTGFELRIDVPLLEPAHPASGDRSTIRSIGRSTAATLSDGVHGVVTFLFVPRAFMKGPRLGPRPGVVTNLAS